MGNHALLGDYLDKHAAPFVAKVSEGPASYQHLEFAGCGAVGMMGGSLESVLGQVYQGLFQKGFDGAEIVARNISIGSDSRFFMQCFNDPAKLQVRANSKEILNKNFDAFVVPEPDRAQITQLFDAAKMTDAEIVEKCIEIRPYMKGLFERWTKEGLQNPGQLWLQLRA